jgi:hypothetical protein
LLAFFAKQDSAVALDDNQKRQQGDGETKGGHEVKGRIISMRLENIKK